MGNAALLAKAQGHEVIGADSGVYPPMCDVLADAGIEVLEGYDAARLEVLKPDQVVIGNAMSRGNPEVEWLLNQSEISFVSLPALLHDTILAGRSPVVIAGTHGKTTTSTLTAYLLESAKAEPGWLIGGVPHDLPSGSEIGKGAAFVIEGDEYDSAFFDKRSKFIHYRPQVAVINNLEMDHADIFRDLEDVQRSFRHFIRIIPGKGTLIVNGDDANIEAILPAPWTRVWRVGTGAQNDLVVRDFEDRPEGARFELYWQGKLWARVNWPLHGLFNARNAAMASLAAATSLGLPPSEFNLDALAAFQGVRRRQDVLFQDGAWTVIEDFAHHPTAVAGAIEALRAAYPERRCTVCFEPRSNTATTSLFQREFEAALLHADRVLLGAVHRAEKVPVEERLNTAQIAHALQAEGMSCLAFDQNSELLEEAKRLADSEDEGGLFVFFTNGSFDGVPQSFAAHLRGA